MVSRAKDVQRRLNLLFDLWNTIINLWEQDRSIDRAKVIEILKREYKKERLSPLRGASLPEDIFDKEMASLYIVGKYGMGLEDQYPDLFDAIFYPEIKYDQIIEIVMSSTPEEAREKIMALLGSIPDDNTIARILRLRFTQVYYGFADEESLKNLAKSLAKVFPEKEKIISKYVRFYIAFKVASAIYRGEVKDRLTKEAMKQGTALIFSDFHGSIPDDKYIRKIASEVFRVNKRVLDHVLAPREKRKKAKQ
ncbi:MAG: DUF2192 domain-containing protein [Desulfurococcales archaeon]|nr:DUF2192 domain-containing protein [Desulfurococcales archaeon]